MTPIEFVLDLVHLVHLVLTRNYFQFRGEFFVQQHGTAMGSSVAPSVACLYVSHFEATHVLLHTNPYIDKIRLFKRYIDDVLMIWCGTPTELSDFNVWINSLDPFLHFTMTSNSAEQMFLDLHNLHRTILC